MSNARTGGAEAGKTPHMGLTIPHKQLTGLTLFLIADVLWIAWQFRPGTPTV